LLLWARQAGDVNPLLQQWQANVGSATLSVYVISLTQTCFKYSNKNQLIQVSNHIYNKTLILKNEDD